MSIDSIDEQHKELIDLVNELNDAMMNGKSNDVMGKVLGDLIEYTASHFEHEEQMMRDMNYPGYDAHKAEHDELVKTALSLQEKFESGKTRMSIEVMRFLKEWLQNHILGTDMQLGEFLKAA